MRCAVMQPAYLPWAGYFNLISQVDVFVFLDDAQFERGTWQNRNRVLVAGEPHWLTVPVIRELLGTGINAVRTDEKLRWRRKHFDLLRQNYGKHAFGAEMLQISNIVGDQSLAILAELNIRLILYCCERLGITTPCVRTSEMGILGKRTERLIKICEHLGCDEYLSPPGAAEYLAADRFVEMTSTRLEFNEYIPETYPQKGKEQFVSHLSIVDVVAGLGWQEAGPYVKRSAALRAVNTTSI